MPTRPIASNVDPKSVSVRDIVFCRFGLDHGFFISSTTVLLNDRLYLSCKCNGLYKPGKGNPDGCFLGISVHGRFFRPPWRNCQAGNAGLWRNGCFCGSGEIEGVRISRTLQNILSGVAARCRDKSGICVSADRMSAAPSVQNERAPYFCAEAVTARQGLRPPRGLAENAMRHRNRGRKPGGGETSGRN